MRSGRLAIGGCLVLGSIALPAVAATSGANGSHDPSRMLESEGRVYIYSTGGGAKSSADGLVWRNEPAPPWNRSLLLNNQGIWAPDGIYLNGRYYLYGSMWSDAKASVIVLTTSPTLNPLSPNYRWTDQGAVVSGPAGVTHSCIDPAPLLDADGNFWIVWGGGYPFATDVDSIFLTPLDKLTGLPLTSDPGYRPPNLPGYALGQGHKEGPYIHYHAGSYYFFYQTGSCCDGAASTYTIHVARSQSVKGPYTGDRTFYASRGSIHGPGHMGVYRACGFERFTYHYYPDTGGSVVGENELVWTADGWPSVGAESTTPLKLCGPTGTIGAGADAGIGRTADADSQGGTGGAAVTDASVERATAGGASGAGGTAGSGGSATGAGGSGLDGSGAGGAGDEGPATGGSTESGDASGSIERRSDPGSSGCSCRVAVPRHSEGAGGVWLLGFALAAFVRRNKRARRELGGQPGEWRRRLEGRLAEAR